MPTSRTTFKLPLPTSFASLCGYIATLRQGLELLAEDLDTKADLPTSVSMTIPITGWLRDEDPEPEEGEEEEEVESNDYPYYYDYPVSGITAANRAEITVAANSIGTAANCGLCPMNETIAGYIRIRAVGVPEEAITAYALIQ